MRPSGPPIWLWALLAVAFGLTAQYQIGRGWPLYSFISIGCGVIAALVAICYAIVDKRG